jgi:hypothetical protein
MDIIQPISRPFHSNLGAPMSTTYIANRYVFEAVGPGETKRFELPVETTKGELQDVKIQCDSADYDIAIYPFATSRKDTISTIYDLKAINILSIARGVSCIWSKYSMPEMQRETHLADIDKSLYLELTNNGLDTGEIIVEIVHQQME